MTVLNDRLWAADHVLRDFSGLPQPCSVDVSDTLLTEAVKMQFTSVRDITEWAVRFDEPVTFSEKSNYVNVSCTINIHDVDIVAWVHLSHREAFHLTEDWQDFAMTSAGITIPASHAFALNAAAVG